MQSNSLQTTACKRQPANDSLQTTACKRQPANDSLQTTACKRQPANDSSLQRQRPPTAACNDNGRRRQEFDHEFNLNHEFDFEFRSRV
jgi:hypothetical protein